MFNWHVEFGVVLRFLEVGLFGGEEVEYLLGSDLGTLLFQTDFKQFFRSRQEALIL